MTNNNNHGALDILGNFKDTGFSKQKTFKGRQPTPLSPQQFSATKPTSGVVRVPDNLSYEFVKDMLGGEKAEGETMSEHSSIYGQESEGMDSR
jgi:hypothetical protein